MLKVFFSDHHPIPLPKEHNFPADKYQLIHRSIINEGILSSKELVPSPMTTREIITLAHSEAYYESIINGTIEPQLMRRIGLPWSKALVNRTLAAVGGSLEAAFHALETGFSGNLSGGTHHASANHGMGFCVFNDLAVTTACLLQRYPKLKIAIIDLDAHQGNGNSAILGQYNQVFIYSMHGRKSFPYHKIPSTLDIPLEEDTSDEEYLQKLAASLPKIFSFDPDIVLYIAGADPLKGDRYGRLNISLQGLAERDYLVLQTCQTHNKPVALVLGGGYSIPVQKTVNVHLQTYRIVKELFDSY